MELSQSDLSSLELDIAHMRRLGGVAAYVASRSDSDYRSLLISRVEQLLFELKLKGDA